MIETYYVLEMVWFLIPHLVAIHLPAAFRLWESTSLLGLVDPNNDELSRSELFQMSLQSFLERVAEVFAPRWARLLRR
jgi:hypothetical protein